MALAEIARRGSVYVDDGWQLFFRERRQRGRAPLFDLITPMAIEFQDGQSVLSPGRHVATVEEVEAALVEGFPVQLAAAPFSNAG
jgi:hypothetical protein